MIVETAADLIQWRAYWAWQERAAAQLGEADEDDPDCCLAVRGRHCQMCHRDIA